MKTVNLQLQVLGVLVVGDVTPSSRLASTSMHGVHTNPTVPPPLKVEELILTLGTNRLLLVLPQSYNGWTLESLKLKHSPQTAPIVKAGFSP